MSAKRAKKTNAKRAAAVKVAPKAAKKPEKRPALKVAPPVPILKKSKLALAKKAPVAKAPAPKVAEKPAAKKAEAKAPTTKVAAARPVKAPAIAKAKTSPVSAAPIGDKVPPGSRDTKMKTDTTEVTAKKKPTVLRVAAGQRVRKEESNGVGGMKAFGKHPNQVFELNPRLESSRGVLPKVEGQHKPMSAAERTRAAAEAAFAQVAPKVTAPAPLPTPVNPHFHKSEFEMRISERDSLTTLLRTTEDKKQAKHAAETLAERFKLPPDQFLLVKIVGLGDKALTKLALEELLELDDRGRVRKNDELLQAITALGGRDKEILELRALFLEKLAPRP